MSCQTAKKVSEFRGSENQVDDKEYEVENLTELAQSTLRALRFTDTRIQELTNMQAHSVLKQVTLIASKKKCYQRKPVYCLGMTKKG